MTELQLIFLAIAMALFAAIVAYSYYQQRNTQETKRQDYVDPLFEELEQRKAGKSKSTASSENEQEQQKDTKLARTFTENSTNQDETDGGKSSILDVTTSAKKKIAPKATLTSKTQSKITGKKAVQNDDKNRFDEATKVSAQSNAKASTGRGASVSGKLEPASHELPKVDSASSIVTELVARVKNPEPIEQKELLTLFRNHDFKFHRKVHVYGLNQLTDLWRDIEFELPSARFVELGVAIQLADRDGAMSNKEWHDFQQMALAFSNEYDAPFEFSMDIDEALKQAQILDQIGRRYDSMAVLNVVPRAKTGFRMADIESCARDLMMSTDKNGIFVKTRGQKQNLAVLYRLACTDGSGHFGVSTGAMSPVHDLVIYMNVPATEMPDRVFQDMVKDANNLATWLDGKVVDRNGKVMTQRSYTVLMQQISDIVYSMQQDGLVPGDAVSKKLF